MDGVVEVLRIRPVDRHQGKVAEIRPVIGHVRDIEGETGRLGQHVIRPVVRYPVRPDRDLGRHPRPFGIAQAFDDAPERTGAPPISRRRLDDLGHHDLSFGALPVRNHHVMGKISVIGRYEGDAAGTEEAPDDGPLVALDDLDHDSGTLGLEAPAPPGRGAARRRPGLRA